MYRFLMKHKKRTCQAGKVVGAKGRKWLKLLAGTQRVWEKLNKAWLNSECGLGDLGESPGS